MVMNQETNTLFDEPKVPFIPSVYVFFLKQSLCVYVKFQIMCFQSYYRIVQGSIERYILACFLLEFYFKPRNHMSITNTESKHLLPPFQNECRFRQLHTN